MWSSMTRRRPSSRVAAHGMAYCLQHITPCGCWAMFCTASVQQMARRTCHAAWHMPRFTWRAAHGVLHMVCPVRMPCCIWLGRLYMSIHTMQHTLRHAMQHRRKQPGAVPQSTYCAVYTLWNMPCHMPFTTPQCCAVFVAMSHAMLHSMMHRRANLLFWTACCKGLRSLYVALTPHRCTDLCKVAKRHDATWSGLA